ncbi:putative immunity protein [Nocardia asteroides]|uniref:putative immunity protein n=1 Tax=Nocardia asteroides TaxID=1824 RepID=UPI001E441362|nr:exonuclease SbcC [Nocardia asteroides]UGT62382.1 exonuclease SbcC [Nocardia asteroides]
MDLDELRAVTAYAITCAEPALTRFERHRPGDPRPRQAVEAARAFAAGGRRTKAIRDGAWAAQRAYREARDAGQRAASEAARAAVAAASAAYLHPIAKATQVWHILGAAAYAAHAAELDGSPSPAGAPPGPAVLAVLHRYPPAPPGRGRAGELLRELDRGLRH